MHSLVRRFIKTAIVFLAVGLGLGGWMMARRELWETYPNSYQVSAHTHAIFVGFVMMMILGVALWLFPRPQAGDSRYSPRLIETSYWMLLVGTVCRIAGELLRMSLGSAWLRWTVLLSGLLQIAALLLFFYTMWWRIRPAGSQGREAKGERF
jgi:heme/copper-type cytochrome/quinol oxidase subunit 1